MGNGAKVRKPCRDWILLHNKYFLAKIGFDTAENEAPKVWQNLENVFARLLSASADDAEESNMERGIHGLQNLQTWLCSKVVLHVCWKSAEISCSELHCGIALRLYESMLLVPWAKSKQAVFPPPRSSFVQVPLDDGSMRKISLKPVQRSLISTHDERGYGSYAGWSCAMQSDVSFSSFTASIWRNPKKRNCFLNIIRAPRVIYNIYYLTCINKKLCTDRKTYWYKKKKPSTFSIY